MTIDNSSSMLHQLHIDQFARPLRFIGAFNIAVILFWIKVFGLFVVNALTSDFSELMFGLIFVSLLGFPAWVSWRTVDVISTVTDPLMRISYLTLGTISLLGILIAGLWMLSDSVGDTNISAVSLGIFFLPWAITTLVAARSLKRLRRKKIDKIGITVDELVRSTQPTSVEGTRWLTARGFKSPEFIRFVVIAVILFILYSAIQAYLTSALQEATFNQPNQFGPGQRLLNSVSEVAFWGACYFLLRARTKLQPTAESVLSMDRRTPVLFLRSFIDDERVRFLHAQRTLFDFSLEARLATHFFKTGPFIAVDSPNHTAAIGAARASLTDTGWQGTVVEWMGAARLIVLLAGLTQWVRWEMRQIVELGYAQKLIILMPELSGWKNRKRRLRSDIATKRLEAIRETFSGSPWEAGINEPCVPEKIRSLMFGPDGQVTAVCAKSRSRDSYQVAALISEYLICKEQKNEVGEAVHTAIGRQAVNAA
jgi:hypothetical protein